MRFACELRKRTPDARFWGCPAAQLIDVGTRQSHRIQVAFTTAQRSALIERARHSGQSLSATIRQLVAVGLRFDTEPGPRSDSPAALAALVASELAALMVASILPDGERRMHSLAGRATEAGAERLALFQPPSGSAEERE